MNDDWNPISLKPRPDDYRPTGRIQVLDVSHLVTTVVNQYAAISDRWTHWRRVTPPKP